MIDKMVGEQTKLSYVTHAYSTKTLDTYPNLIRNLLYVKIACAYANSELSIISTHDYEKISAACFSLVKQPTLFYADVMQGGGGVAVHVNVSEAICHVLNDAEFIGKVNASQSTTDVCSTALNITLAAEIHHTKITCDNLVIALETLVEKYQDYETIGRTCLRDASPLTQGARFSGFVALFKRQANALAAHDDFAISNLGATALGTSHGIDPAIRLTYSELAAKKLSELTKLPIRIHSHFIDSVQNRDDMYALASTIELFAISLLKIAKDIRLLASGPEHGFNEIELPAIIKGSSFYKHKINPTMEESVIQMGFIIQGLIKTAKCGFEHAELDMNIYYLQSAICLLDAMTLINTLLPKYVKYNLSNIKINQK